MPFDRLSVPQLAGSTSKITATITRSGTKFKFSVELYLRRGSPGMIVAQVQKLIETTSRQTENLPRFTFMGICQLRFIHHIQPSSKSMNPQSLLARTVLLLGSIVMLLLAPKVNGCVNFQAYYTGPASGGVYPLSAQLYDGGTEVCWLDAAFRSDDGLFHFTCIAANYAATMNPTITPPAVVQYSSPSGNNAWSTPYDDTKQTWYVCEYGCVGSECFVPVHMPGQPGK